ncbi:MAG: hypothetical protein AAFR67_14580 [Chloroflexota bacterium]
MTSLPPEIGNLTSLEKLYLRLQYVNESTIRNWKSH